MQDRYNIYNNLEIMNNINIDNFNEYNKSLILNKKFSLYIYDNLRLNNKNLILKLINLNLNRFINFINPIIYQKLIKIFKKILFIYIIFLAHEIYNKYIILSSKLRKIKFRHLYLYIINIKIYNLNLFLIFINIILNIIII
jgi:hypothetical protein